MTDILIVKVTHFEKTRQLSIFSFRDTSKNNQRKRKFEPEQILETFPEIETKKKNITNYIRT